MASYVVEYLNSLSTGELEVEFLVRLINSAASDARALLLSRMENEVLGTIIGPVNSHVARNPQIEIENCYSRAEEFLKLIIELATCTDVNILSSVACKCQHWIDRAKRLQTSFPSAKMEDVVKSLHRSQKSFNNSIAWLRSQSNPPVPDIPFSSSSPLQKQNVSTSVEKETVTLQTKSDTVSEPLVKKIDVLTDEELVDLTNAIQNSLLNRTKTSEKNVPRHREESRDGLQELGNNLNVRTLSNGPLLNNFDNFNRSLNEQTVPKPSVNFSSPLAWNKEHVLVSTNDIHGISNKFADIFKSVATTNINKVTTVSWATPGCTMSTGALPKPRDPTTIDNSLHVKTSEICPPLLNSKSPIQISEMRQRNNDYHSRRQWNIEFNGSNAMNVHDFIHRLQSMAIDDDLPINRLTRVIRHYLSGKASDWYWIYKQNFPNCNWREMSQALSSFFSGYESENDILEQINRRHQGKKESFTDFALEILKSEFCK